MRRKIIKQRDSYTITLPMKWVKAHDVDRIREVDLEDDKGELVIKTQGARAKKEATLELSSDDKRFLQFVMLNYYRSGHDKVTLKGSIKQKYLLEALEMLPGFEVTDITEKSADIESMSEATEEKLDALIRQDFLITKGDMDDIIECLKNRKKIDVEKIEMNSKRVLKNSNFCLRMISKRKKDFNGFYWTLINLITWIERRLFYMAKAVSDKRMERLEKAQLDFITCVKDCFENLYDGVYKKSLKSFELIHNQYNDYETKRYSIMQKQTLYMSILMHEFILIFRYTYQATSSGIGIIIMK